MIRKGRYGQFIRSIFTIIDFIIVNITYFIVCKLSNASDVFFHRQVWLMLNMAYFVVVYLFPQVHTKRILFADKIVLFALKAVLVFIAVFMALLLFLDLPELNMNIFIKYYVSLFSVFSIWWIISRKLLKKYRSLGFNFKRVIIIGGGALGVRLLNEMLSDAGYGYKVMGFFDDRKGAKSIKNYKGPLADVEQFIKENQIDEMYCTISNEKDDTTHKLIKIAEQNAVDYFYVPSINLSLSRTYDMYSIGDLPVLSLRPNPLSSMVNKSIKRIFDLIFSTVFLVISPIIFIPIAICIKITSPGPIFFKQLRTGYRGEEFMCYKFRTMRVNKQSDSMQATKHDPRKTKLGEFLRKTSIDELPQFINVFKGDMSVVGPRPHMIKHTQDYSELIDKYMLRHVIKPGITGWAQVHGLRGQTEELWQMERRVEYDVWYTENWNFMLDMKIIFLTIINAIVGERNAF